MLSYINDLSLVDYFHSNIAEFSENHPYPFAHPASWEEHDVFDDLPQCKVPHVTAEQILPLIKNKSSRPW